MKKQAILIMLMVMFAALAGCTAPQPGYYEQLTAAVNESTDSIIQALEVSEAVPKAQLAKLDAKIDVIQSSAIEAAKAYDEKANNDKLGALIDAAIVLNAKSAPINPYKAMIGGVLTLGSVGFGALKKIEADKERRGKEASDKKYKSMKQGANAFMQKNEASELYDEIGKARARNGVT